MQGNTDPGQGGTPGDGGTPQPGGNPPAGDPSPALNFDSWIEGQPQDVRDLIDGHVTGLKSALQKQREETRDLASSLRDATGKLEKGSDARKEFDAMSAKIEEAERRVNFYESAPATIRNVKAAFTLAVADNLFKRNGDPDWDAIQTAYPELFGEQRRPGAGAGAGTGGSPPGSKTTMDDLIRGNRPR